MQKIMYNQQYGLEEAVIEGRKNMTRRIAHDGELENPHVEFNTKDGEPSLWDGNRLIATPRYHIGEVVAVAQSYETVLENMIKSKGGYGEEENEFYGIYKDTPGWKNKMFVKAELMPVKQKCTDIKVERLQDISDEDTLREGVRVSDFSSPQNQYFIDGIKRKGNTLRYEDEQGWHTFKWQTYEKAIHCFAVLIDKVSGKGTWEKNPWVFAYSFELIK